MTSYRVAVFDVLSAEVIPAGERMAMPCTRYSLRAIEWLGEAGPDVVDIIMPGAIFGDGSIYQVVDVPILARDERILLAIDPPVADGGNYLVASVREGLFRKAVLDQLVPAGGGDIGRSGDELLHASDGETNRVQQTEGSPFGRGLTWDVVVAEARYVRGGGR